MHETPPENAQRQAHEPRAVTAALTHFSARSKLSASKRAKMSSSLKACPAEGAEGSHVPPGGGSDGGPGDRPADRNLGRSMLVTWRLTLKAPCRDAACEVSDGPITRTVRYFL